jgi:hypothetical protein
MFPFVRKPIGCLVVVSCLAVAHGSTSRASAAGVPANAASLDWLAGCWANEGGEPGSGEQWMPAAGGTLLGVSRTVRGGRTVEWEFVQIRETTDGRIDYVANPSGQEQAAFRLVSLEGTAAVFENPAHDFPQRILYRRDGDALRARIEGSLEGKAAHVEFPMRRRDCEAPLGRTP